MSVSARRGPERGSDIKDTLIESTVADSSKRSLEIFRLYMHKGTHTSLTLKHTSYLAQTTVKSTWHLRKAT